VTGLKADPKVASAGLAARSTRRRPARGLVFILRTHT
jgi:hypothetical protein